jgi:hypothetical protein
VTVIPVLIFRRLLVRRSTGYLRDLTLWIADLGKKVV